MQSMKLTEAKFMEEFQIEPSKSVHNACPSQLLSHVLTTRQGKKKRVAREQPAALE